MKILVLAAVLAGAGGASALGADPSAAKETGDMPNMDMSRPAGHVMAAMPGTLGPTANTREASGTSWQPDDTPHLGLHTMSGDWMTMAHALVNGVYDRQDGPRGGDKAFISGMVMGMARRDLGDGDAWGLRAMLSPDPFMGKRGYPLLLASGETANAVTPLVDRQHPHDLFMELSTSYSHAFDGTKSLFVYAGWPGEPAFGPPAFMHRLSIMDSPEAPISHHWLDSTHITMGVVTAGLVSGDWKIDASRFTGREPDQKRFDLDRPTFDSTAARLSWNPSAQLSLQVSWAQVYSPEQLAPKENQTRWSASAIYTVPFGATGTWSTTLAWGRKNLSDGPTLDAGTLETALRPTDLWTIFARGEIIQSNELAQGTINPSAVETAGKASLGVIRDVRLSDHAKIGLGGLFAVNWVSSALQASYGGNPGGAMVFLRLKVE